MTSAPGILYAPTIKSVDDILKYIGINIPISSYEPLKKAISEFDKETGVSFLRLTFPGILNLASQLNLRNFLAKTRNNEFQLTRLEIAAYLANCFLCKLDALQISTQGGGPAIHKTDSKFKFLEWFTKEGNENVQKILCLMKYFNHISKSSKYSPAFLTEKVCYKKHTVKLLGQPIENPHKEINPLHLDTRIEPELLGKRTAKVVFVDNLLIGEQLFTNSCSQEEIELIVRPELMLTSLLGRVNDNEAVTVDGAKKFSCHTGFGDTFKFVKESIPNIEVSPLLVLSKFRVVGVSGRLRQYNEKAIKGYVASAFAAFMSLEHIDKITFEFWGWRDDKVPAIYKTEVATAMVADPAVVVVSMWIAASLAFKEAIFRQNINYNLGADVKTLCAAFGNATIDTVYQALLSYCKLMKTNPKVTTHQNDIIFDSIKLKPGFMQVEVDKNHKIFKWINKKMLNTIVTHQNLSLIKSYNILSVYKIINYRLWERYLERKWHIEGRNYEKSKTRLFHGTTAATSIAINGFDVKYSDLNGMLGKGIYFADLSSKSVQYTNNGGFRKGCSQHNNIECTSCPRSMLLCRVTMGKKHLASKTMCGEKQPPRGCHSVEANPTSLSSLQYPEYAVYDNYQAYPSYLVNFTINV